MTPRPFAAGDDVGGHAQARGRAAHARPGAVGGDPQQHQRHRLRQLQPLHRGRDLRRARPDDDRLPAQGVRHKLRTVKRRTALPFPNVDRYRLLKAATEVFLMIHCGVDLDDFSGVDLEEESRRLNRTVDRADLEAEMREYLVQVPPARATSSTCCPTWG